MSLIEFKHVKKAFGKQVIYEDLTLDVRKGETLVVLGGSGTGKSVMLKILIGLLQPDAGDVLVDGANVVGWTDEQFLPVRKRISMLFQGGALFDSISVADNVAYPLREHGIGTEEEIRARVSRALERVGLPGTEDKRPADLSGGMRKRAALARAIIAEPEVILWDEPTTGLDPANTRRISELVLQMQKELGITSIVVTHDMPCAFMVADRLALLKDKRIHLQATAEEFQRTTDKEVRDFIFAMEMPAIATPPMEPRK